MLAVDLHLGRVLRVRRRIIDGPAFNDEHPRHGLGRRDHDGRAFRAVLILDLLAGIARSSEQEVVAGELFVLETASLG